MPRFFVCCHQARWSGTSGGRIVESRRGRRCGGQAVGHMRRTGEAPKRRRGDPGVSKWTHPNRSALLLTEPDSSRRQQRSRSFWRYLTQRARRSFTDSSPRPCRAGSRELDVHPRCLSRPRRVSLLCDALFQLRASSESAQQRMRRRFYAIHRASIAFFSRLLAGRFGRASGLILRPPSILDVEILFDQKSVTVGDRLDRTRLWAPSLPVISPRVRLVARFSG